MRSDLNKVFVRSARLVFILCALCVSVVNVFAQEWKTVADGVEYAQVRREFSGKPVDINLLRLDLKKVRLDVHHAMDMAIGTETTSSIATRHKAFAAINAGFFRLDTSLWAGDAAGVLMIDGILLSEARDSRATLSIINAADGTLVDFGNVQIEPGIAGSGLSIGLNRECRDDEAVIFTPEFGRTTLTGPNATEILVEKGKVRAIIRNGSNQIPRNGFVVSFGASASHGDSEKLKIGSKVNLISLQRSDLTNLVGKPSIFLSNSYSFAQIEDITNGVPQLIRNGKIDITWEQEKTTKSFVETRHPRTAVAKLKDGKFLMLTADGRTEQSAGLDLYDLAKYMLELGAIDAMNLDGGGSTTMFLDGKVVNRVSEKHGERKVSDAILVTLRNKRKR